jgi:hypothetical protein
MNPQSGIDIEDPMRVTPYTDTAEPIRTKERTLNAEPKLM